ncbi:LOW QUALITY PROTEIN: Hypothetical protein PHPALM_1468 [Phytophthora palmivora]|uniref:Uncharacterized protein n=1 Tax=Phytophthora palmivora TaxID=4796 RepID=A0A2P4YSB0_9STRA|nr:LOW QUALITY PROTEIN: Hypothetical protein PHPALM_1468 [Phytophthora palmivora]
MLIQMMYHRCPDETKWTKYVPEYYYTLAEVILRDRLARGVYPPEWPELCDVMKDSLNAHKTMLSLNSHPWRTRSSLKLYLGLNPNLRHWPASIVLNAQLNFEGTLEEVASSHFSESSAFPEFTPMEDALLSEAVPLQKQASAHSFQTSAFLPVREFCQVQTVSLWCRKDQVPSGYETVSRVD